MIKSMKEIPEKFYHMVQPKVSLPTEADFRFIVPSGQFWNDLTPKEQDELRRIVTTAGKDLDDYLYQMRRMLPKDPDFHKRK